MTAPHPAKVPSFEDFVRPLVGDSPPAATTPLSQLPAGDYAVLAWLDDVQARYPAGLEADIVAGWDTASLRDIYAMVVAGADDAAVGPA
jgi:hypothetical protein